MDFHLLCNPGEKEADFPAGESSSHCPKGKDNISVSEFPVNCVY